MGFYDFEGSPIGARRNYKVEVYSEEEVTVPAGTYTAYGVGLSILSFTIKSHSGESYDIFGRLVDDTDKSLRDEITDPSPAQFQSWGFLKRIYQ